MWFRPKSTPEVKARKNQLHWQSSSGKSYRSMLISAESLAGLKSQLWSGIRMNLVESDNGVWTPSTEEDKVMVRRQMNRLLDTSHFRNSRRYPVLFRYIVEETLEGRGEFLKERLLGVHVFDRPVDYDTAADPIVRVTIAEIRKRIAQYYHEKAHDSEMRIELLPGRYVPEFHFSKEAGLDRRQAPASARTSAEALDAESAFGPSEAQTAAIPTNGHGRNSRFPLSVKYALGTVAALLIAFGVTAFWKWTHPSAIDELWRPLLANRQTIIFCLPVGTRRGEATAAAAGILVGERTSTTDNVVSPALLASDSSSAPTFLAYEVLGESVAFSDTLATLRLSNYLAARHRESNFRPNTSTTLDDLRQGPVVLIGGLDNQWTLRALAPLRYRFAGTDHEQYWIIDTKNPAMKDWRLDLNAPLSDVKRDFAIIARIHDESIGQVEMIVAGIGMSGTAAAGEFLVDPQGMEELRRRIGSGFRDRDFEAVLSMDVVDGVAGSPRILDVAIK
jgi:hypothetical protein